MTANKSIQPINDLIGKPAPGFTASSTIGEITLKQCLGRAVVLYFYPKDNTPGCTTETENFRDLHDAFVAANCAIAGASRDSLKSHENFSKKLGLPFPLIADPDESLCESYGVMKLKNMYGKQVRGIERSTFLIDAQGRLAKVWRGVKVPGHAQEVLEAARTLASAKNR
jgi:peroxiredoxin Q/BCP